MTLQARFGRSSAESDIPIACLVSDAVGDIMCIRDIQTVTGRWRVQKAEPTSGDKMPGIGVLIRKDTPTTGVMRILGDVTGIFSGMSVLEDYYVGASGSLVNPAPAPDPGESVWVQKFGFPVSGDVLRLTGESWMVLRKL